MVTKIKQKIIDFYPELPNINSKQLENYQEERMQRNIRFSLILAGGALCFEIIQSFFTIVDMANLTYPDNSLYVFSLGAIPFMVLTLSFYYFFIKKQSIQRRFKYLLLMNSGWLLFAAIEDTLGCTHWYCPNPASNNLLFAILIFFGSLILKPKEILGGILLAVFCKLGLTIIFVSPNIFETITLIVSCLAFIGGFHYRYLFDLQRYSNKVIIAEQAAALKKADALKTTLYTNITHEFRTPLTVIKGMVSELPDKTASKKMILRNTQTLLKMVNQLLDLAKLESGNMTTNYQQTDIIPFLNYQTESWSSYANTKSISLNFYTNIPYLEMDFDAEKLEQIITNLLSNALKFTPKYGKIQVVAEHLEQELVLIIKDTGVGIKTEDLSYIFDRFYQADGSSTRKQEGTGIGLSLVQELVHLLAGRIEIESKKRQGTTFRIYFPISNNAAKQTFTKSIAKDKLAHIPVENNLNQSSETPDNLPSILVIEDNQDVALYIQTCLQGRYQIQTANNGRIGLELAQKQLPDIILCDVMMPEMDGFEVCQLLKEATLTCHIPIILLTAKATQIDKNEGLSYGADAYLTKPFDKEELLIRLENLIKIRKQIQLRFAQGDLLNTSVVAEISPKDRAFLNMLTQYIQDHIKQEDLEIIYLQKAVNMSRAQLHKKLKALTGMNASQFRKTVRLQEAKRILTSDTDLTIAEVAYQVGYKHPSHFSRDFKELFGVAPKFSKTIDL